MNIKFVKGENELENKEKRDLKRLEGLYRLKVGNMNVDMIYSKNNKSFNECMLNILKLKTK